MKLSFKVALSFVLCAVVVDSAIAVGSSKVIKSTFKYKTYFSKCPSEVAGKLTLSLLREFEANRSLKSVKRLITEQKLQEKHFVSEYDISYNPTKKMLSFRYQCPTPLLRAQVFKQNGVEAYSAILVSDGSLYDPTYEVLLRREGKLTHRLPSFALSESEFQKETHKKISDIVVSMQEKFRKRLAELILNESGELTLILSINDRPSSAFLGLEQWTEKVRKLHKIVDFMEVKKKIPAVINMTNSKKVVVKFKDNI